MPSTTVCLFQDGRGCSAVVEGEIAGPGQTTGLGRGEDLGSGFAGLNPPELRIGGLQRMLAAAALAEHGVCLGGVQEGQAGEDLAGAGRGAGGFLGEREPGFRVPVTVQGDEALAQRGQAFGGLVTTFPCRADRLIEVSDRGAVVAALGRLPGRAGPSASRPRLQPRAARAARIPGRARGQEGDLAETLPRIGDQPGRGARSNCSSRRLTCSRR